MSEIFSIKNATKKINNQQLFQLDNFSANKGELITILGKSGAGKSTLLNILGLNQTFTSGTFHMFGQPVNKMTRKEKTKIKRNEISFLFQDFGLVEYETIDFNLNIGLKFKKMSIKEKNLLKIETLKKINLKKDLKTPVYLLSGGEKQRIALARTLLKGGSIILADEPTGSLDESNKKIVFSLLKELVAKDFLVIVVTHDTELANLGTKCMML
ncbi:ABC transporter ATP-binding protein [Enterococcus villorum]|uniref:ABC transporter ATP-binding protein n=1 Tax=Enterococcus villorum TaxID=112904 RepID=A0A1V8YWJ7_9ENTE|nr:ATP-binding cassette domain-containing protein [Enterococcus villorum]OQO70224.1 ABC transporter ATP-binding protein [Enterococcus villorum]OQO76954.1 ABC transporter ATP-binding protein [Enterococcus villorum]